MFSSSSDFTHDPGGSLSLERVKSTNDMTVGVGQVAWGVVTPTGGPTGAVLLLVQLTDRGGA